MRKPTLLFVNLLAMRLTLDAHGNDATSSDFDPTLIVQWGFHWQWESGTGLANLFGAGSAVSGDLDLDPESDELGSDLQTIFTE